MQKFVELNLVKFQNIFNSESSQISLTKVSLTVTLQFSWNSGVFCFACQQKIVDYTGMTSNSATLSWHDDTRDSNDDVYVRVSTLAQSSFAHTQQKIIMWLLLYGILFLASVYFCTNLITSTNKSLRRGPYAGVYTRPGTINPVVYLQGVPT